MSEANSKNIPAIVVLGDAGLAPDNYRPEEYNILSGDPDQTVSNRFSSADGKFNCGIWTGQVGSWRVAFTENEFCQLLEGTITLRGDDGSVRTFHPGDAFVVPAGFIGVWEVVHPAKKYYAVYE